MYLDTYSLPPLPGVGVGGFALPTCSCPGEHRAQSSWEALGFLSVVPIPKWMTLHRCVWEAEGKRAWSSLDGEESKSTHM